MSLDSRNFSSLSPIRQMTVAALLLCLGLILSYLERLSGIDALLPFPGAKVGLANLVTLFCLYFTDRKTAFLVLTLRVLLQSLLFSGFGAFLYGFLGGSLALLTMALLQKGWPRSFSFFGISIGGAAAHQLGQVLAAALLLKTGSVFSYLGWLWIAALLTGGTMGGIFSLLYPRLKKAVNWNP